MPSKTQELAVGQLRRKLLLGSEALYRVCDLGEALVEVEVVQAPGLPSGRRFNVTRNAAEDMDLVPDRA